MNKDDDTELIHDAENKDEDTELIQRRLNSFSIVKEYFYWDNCKRHA